MNDAADFEKRVHQTMEHIANHPPFTSPYGSQQFQGPGHQFMWAGDPNYLPWMGHWGTIDLNPICPHCGKCRHCGR